MLHVAEHLVESYGEERFYVPKGMQKLVADGKLGAKTGGDGFYDPQGEPNIPGENEPDVAELVELLSLKTFLEACLVLEEGVATHRDIDFGMMAGAGLDPRRGLLPPFMKADSEGLDTVLERHGERRRSATASASRRRRSCAAWSPRAGSGRRAARASTPTRSPTPSSRPRWSSSRRASDGVAIAWLANGQMNSISPAGDRGPAEGLGAGQGAAGVRALVIASSNPFLYCAGADIKAFTTMDEAAGARADRRARTRCSASSARRASSTIAAVNGLAFGGGCELAMACDVRIAARSAMFGQPEIKLGIIPGFGGTQRLPRLVGSNKALEMNLVGDPILAEEAFELGLVNRLVEDHELLDTALQWARKLAGQAPLAVGADQARLRRRRPRRRASRPRSGRSRRCSRAPTRRRASRRSSANARRDFTGS